MKNIFYDLKKFIYIKRREILVMLCVEVGLALIGEILLAIVMYTSRLTEDYFQVGSLMAIIGTVVIMFITSISSSSDFNLLLSMGLTRKRFYIINILYEIMIMALCIAVIYGTYFICALPHRIMYNFVDWSNVDDIGKILKPGYVLFGACMLIAFAQIMTYVFIRFKNLGFVILWCVWMICFVVIPKSVDVIGSQNNAVGKIAGPIIEKLNIFYGTGFGLAGVVILCIVSVIVYKLMSKQQVTL